MTEISVSGLVKSFEIGNNILDGITFQVETGERVGLLGRNGAGKSTLFKILTGEYDYDSGEVSDALAQDYGIATRPGAHCAPRMHRALGTERQGAVRFSFGWFNTEHEIDTAIRAVKELAE